MVLLDIVWFCFFLSAADFIHWLSIYYLDFSLGNLGIVSQQPVLGFALATSLSAMMAAALTSRLRVMV